MPAFMDLTGKRFGRLVILSRATELVRTQWHYVCDCGKRGVARTGDLRSGRHQSCGCLHKERVTSHGKARSPTYKIWTAMIQRCTRPNFPKYKYYGGRGITVCERWRTFENFLADMGEQPGKRMSIDRIDVNGHYEPGNCRWISMAQQQLNRRNNRRITIGARTQTVKEWCNELGIDEELFRSRLKLGWTPYQILTTPIQGQTQQDPQTGRWVSRR